MSRPKYDHLLHIYERVGEGPMFRCIKPGCTHVIHKYLLVSRHAECPDCHEGFILKDEHLRRKRVHCIECTKIRLPEDGVEDKFEALLREAQTKKGENDNPTATPQT